MRVAFISTIMSEAIFSCEVITVNLLYDLVTEYSNQPPVAIQKRGGGGVANETLVCTGLACTMH